MKKKLVELITFFMVAVLSANLIIFSPPAATSVQAASYTYDANAAIAYAAAHWDDGNGLCAAFVSRCVQAGGLNNNVKGYVVDMVDEICRVTGISKASCPQVNLDSSGYATKSLNPDLQIGDVIYYYCPRCGQYQHTVIVGGFSGDRATYYAHNRAKNNVAFNLNSYHYKNDGNTCGTRNVPYVIHLSGSREAAPGSQVIADGRYTIVNAETSSGLFYLDIAGDALKANDLDTVWLWGPTEAQPGIYDAWDIKYANGFYTLTQPNTNMALDVDGARTEAGANIQAYTSNNGSAQLWRIDNNGSGYRLTAKCSGQCVDNSGMTMVQANNIFQYPANESNAQRWIFIPYCEGQKLSVANQNPTDVIKNVSVTDIDCSGYTVTCELANYAISKIVFPTWTTANGQDDINPNWPAEEIGHRSGNTVSFRVNTSAHGNQIGTEYITHIYAFDYFNHYVCLDNAINSRLTVNVPSQKEEQPVIITTKEPENKATTPVAAPTTKPATSKPTLTANNSAAAKPTQAASNTTTSKTSNTSSNKSSSKNGVTDFVNRIYTNVLNRKPESEGAAYWVSELTSLKKTGAEVAQGFIFSREFTDRNVSDVDFVKILYSTFFGREADNTGLDYWLTELKSNSMSREDVANGFIYSHEWTDICAKYGIKSGASGVEPTKETIAFIERMYTTAMKRKSDTEGKKYWAAELANFNITGEQVGAAFFLSDEMKDYGLDDKEFITRLYKTFMDREPEQTGFEYWTGYLADGGSRDGAVYGFTRSAEFVTRCMEARILPYN